MIDAIIRSSIRNRWLVMLVVLGVAVLGAYSFLVLPIDAVPDITNVQVQVNTEAPGYSPLEAEQRVTYLVETAMAGLPNLDYTRSLSRYGLSQVTVVFLDGTDVFFARQLVNERIQEVKSQLPAELEPSMGPVATGLGEIYMYTVDAKAGARKPDGTAYTATDLRTVQDWIVRPQLRQVPGITEINTVGGYEKQFHVTPDPAKLLAFDLTLHDVIEALSRNNANVGAGYIEKNGSQYLIRAPGQVATMDDIRRVVVATRDGTPVTIADVAEVLLGKELRTGAATLNGGEVVLGTAFMLIGENSRTVSQRVAAKIDEVQPSLPEGIEVNTVYDRTTLVDKTIATVETNLLEGALLVIVVLFLMLGNLRAAFLTALVIPLSNQVSRENGKRRVVVTSNVRDRDLGSFVADVRQAVEASVVLPDGYWVEYGGTFEQLASAANRLRTLVPLSLVLIFGLLFMTFGSARDAALVFSGVPLALTGGVAALWLRDIPLSISAGVGFITLSGVAVLTGVVMVSYIRDLRHEGKALEEAIIEGAMTRLRPILMIALVASLGFLPMALNTSTGAEVQRPLATVVIGGIISATLLTLIVLPALYRMFHRRYATVLPFEPED